MFLTKISPKLLTISLLALSVFIFGALAVLATRTIWVDEARLLVNLQAISLFDVFKPLPHYDQASPVIPLIITKILSMVAGTNFILSRLLEFAVMTLFMLPLMSWLKAKKGLQYLAWFIFAYAAVVYITAFYASEIKHYGFEMAAVFLFLYWFLVYLDDQAEDQTNALGLKLIWIPIFCVYAGFSTLLLIPAFFAFVLVNACIQQPFKLSALLDIIKKHAKLAILMGITGVFTYMQMQQLTVFQIGNSYLQEVYANKGLVADSIQLAQNFIEIYRKPFLIASALMSFAALFLSPKSSAFKLNLLLIITVAMIVVLKLIGVYPVIYGRHVLWVLPMSLVLTALVMPALWQASAESGSKVSWQAIVFVIATGLLLLAFTLSFIKVLKGDNAEVTNNDSLYAALNQQPASDVLVFAEAQPSLEVFKNTQSMSHRFYGASPDERISSVKAPIADQTLTDWQYKQLPQHQDFLVIITHADAIQTEPAGRKIKALRATFKKNSCRYSSVYQGVKAQLLKVSCQ